MRQSPSIFKVRTAVTEREARKCQTLTMDGFLGLPCQTCPFGPGGQWRQHGYNTSSGFHHYVDMDSWWQNYEDHCAPGTVRPTAGQMSQHSSCRRNAELQFTVKGAPKPPQYRAALRPRVTAELKLCYFEAILQANTHTPIRESWRILASKCLYFKPKA